MQIMLQTKQKEAMMPRKDDIIVFFCSFPAFPGQTIYLMQLCTQNAEAIAVRMVMMKLITVFQFSFFMLCIF